MNQNIITTTLLELPNMDEGKASDHNFNQDLGYKWSIKIGCFWGGGAGALV